MLASPELTVDGVERAARIREMQVMLESLSAWSEEMLRLDKDTLTKVLKLGARIQKLNRKLPASIETEFSKERLKIWPTFRIGLFEQRRWLPLAPEPETSPANEAD